MSISFFSWTRERKLVSLAIIFCFALSVYILLGHLESCPPVLAALPLVVAAAIYLEYPPLGKGVGCKADSLTGLQFVTSDAAASGLGADGVLQSGHAYAIIFVRADKGCHKALGRIEQIWQHCQQQKRCHLLVLSLAAPEELDTYRKIPLGTVKKGLGAKVLTVPLACDAEGEATKRYMRQHGAFVVPHGFVVGPDGVIVWHGHTNRTRFVGALSDVIKKLEPAPAAGAKVD